MHVIDHMPIYSWFVVVVGYILVVFLGPILSLHNFEEKFYCYYRAKVLR